MIKTLNLKKKKIKKTMWNLNVPSDMVDSEQSVR